MIDRIYLDNNGTTKIDERAKIALGIDINGNASSKGSEGQYARYAYNRCISTISRYFGFTEDHEIIFTSGASESNCSIIISSVLTAYKPERIPILVISSYEHKATIKCCEQLESRGFCQVINIIPNKKGIVEPGMIENLLDRLSKSEKLNRVVLVSIMHINNEIGSKNDIDKIALVCKKYGVIFHSDCVQSIKYAHRDNFKNLDAFSISFHKFGGPKGVGLLVLNKNTIKEYFSIISGSQQHGYRGGTENINMMLAGTVALEVMRDKREIKNGGIEDIRKAMLAIMKTQFSCYYFHQLSEAKNISADKPYIIIFGPSEDDYHNRAPSTIYFSVMSVPEIDNGKILEELNKKKITIGTGSACNTALSDHSHSLASINVPPCMAKCVFRISIGDENLQYPKETIASMHIICKTILDYYNSLSR